MRSRSLGISFIVAVIVPSILLAMLSIRSASREEAWLERQVAAALDADVTRAAGLADAEVGRVVDELRAGLDVPAGSDYGKVLGSWKQARPLVAVPYLLSPRYGVLWPPSDSRADSRQKRFLQDNGDFLTDRAATSVLQNIAVRYQGEILGADKPEASLAAPETSRADRSEGQASELPVPAAPAAAPARAAPPAFRGAPQAARSVPSGGAPSSGAAARQMAIDTFAQSPAVQNRVYEEAREKGDQLNARVVSPTVSSSADVNSPQQAPPAADKEFPALSPGPTDGVERSAAPSAEASAGAPARKDSRAAAGASAPAPASAAPSQFVVTSQLLSQIASRGEYGLIPRFVTSQAAGDRLEFLFWARQKDGRIAGCEIDGAGFRSRIASVLTSTWTPVRILTFLDENGAPLAAPPDSAGRDWRRPFVAREIGESLPRWEAAAYLTRPDAISSQARSSSLVIWVLVMILFVSVAGGGAMVLSSVLSEMRLAQQKATFVANVSHELKTPLTSISLFVDLLRRRGPLSAAKREQYLSLMASETERLTRLINNVLDFSRDKGSRRYAMKDVDAGEVTEQLVESQRVRLESRGFGLTLERLDAPLPVRADPEALKQVLLNLLSNAEKYSREEHEIRVKALRQGTEVLIVVEDHGIGIPEAEREKIFREFYRVDTSLSSGVQGTGLGLSIARRIARDHGGEVTCAARPGGGSRFTVRLPSTADGPAPAGNDTLEADR